MGVHILRELRRRLVRDDAAQDLLEYALIVALIAVVAAGAVGTVGNTIKNVFWGYIANAIP
jgi:Flp pilus assembly pilin Flp